MGNRPSKHTPAKLLAVIIWCVLAVGIYLCLCGTSENGSDEIKYQAEVEFQNDTEEEAFSDTIRVLIKTDDYSSIYHEKLCFSCEQGLVMEYGESFREYGAGEECVISRESFLGAEDSSIKITGKNNSQICVTNLKRNADAVYRGCFEVYCSSEGLVLVNELGVEEYLYGVVPSEMPSSYPEEALKAQAICARTYTYFHKNSGYAYPEWQAHIDDSTSYQVYKNTAESDAATAAVDATRDCVITYGGDVIESFYYSTSSGYNGGAMVWGDDGGGMDAWLVETGEDVFAQNDEEGEAAYKAFIDSGNLNDAEYGEAWYRWDYEKSLDGEYCGEFLSQLYALSLQYPDEVLVRSMYLPADKLADETAVEDIRVLTRQRSGLVTAILVKTESFTVSVKTQYVIRLALGASGDVITKNDGTQYAMGDLLASAYFYIEEIYSDNNLNGIAVHGAGFGHGCGMSQNGAKCLALQGCTADEILAYYYNGEIQSVVSR